jgi:hypothetical protein
MGVGKSGDGNTQNNIEDGKGEAVQQAELKVRNIQRFANGINEQRQNSPIKK